VNFKLYRNILVNISYDPISLRNLCNVYVIIFVGCDTNMVHCMTYNSSSSDEQESDDISFGGRPYVYYNNIVNNRYIASP